MASSPPGASARDNRTGGARLRWHDRGPPLAHRRRRRGTRPSRRAESSASSSSTALRWPSRGAQQSISIVMIAGAAPTLAAQWGLIPASPQPAPAHPLGRYDRGRRHGNDHPRHRPVRAGPGLRPGLGRLRPFPPRLHRRRHPRRLTAEQGGVAGIITSVNGIGLRRRPDDRHGALRHRPALALRRLRRPARWTGGVGPRRASLRPWRRLGLDRLGRGRGALCLPIARAACRA